MSFTDDLDATVKAAEATLSKEEQESKEFEREWSTLRLLIRSRHDETVRYLRKEKPVGAGVEEDTLEVVWQSDRRKFKYKLEFRADEKARMVVCSSSFDEKGGHAFPIKELSQAVLEQTIREFVFSALTNKPATPGWGFV